MRAESADDINPCVRIRTACRKHGRAQIVIFAGYGREIAQRVKIFFEIRPLARIRLSAVAVIDGRFEVESIFVDGKAGIRTEKFKELFRALFADGIIGDADLLRLEIVAHQAARLCHTVIRAFLAAVLRQGIRRSRIDLLDDAAQLCIAHVLIRPFERFGYGVDDGDAHHAEIFILRIGVAHLVLHPRAVGHHGRRAVDEVRLPRGERDRIGTVHHIIFDDDLPEKIERFAAAVFLYQHRLRRGIPFLIGKGKKMIHIVIVPVVLRLPRLVDGLPIAAARRMHERLYIFRQSGIQLHDKIRKILGRIDLAAVGNEIGIVHDTYPTAAERNGIGLFGLSFPVVLYVLRFHLFADGPAFAGHGIIKNFRERFEIGVRIEDLVRRKIDIHRIIPLALRDAARVKIGFRTRRQERMVFRLARIERVDDIVHEFRTEAGTPITDLYVCRGVGRFLFAAGKRGRTHYERQAAAGGFPLELHCMLHSFAKNFICLSFAGPLFFDAAERHVLHDGVVECRKDDQRGHAHDETRGVQKVGTDVIGHVALDGKDSHAQGGKLRVIHDRIGITAPCADPGGDEQSAQNRHGERDDDAEKNRVVPRAVDARRLDERAGKILKKRVKVQKRCARPADRKDDDEVRIDQPEIVAETVRRTARTVDGKRHHGDRQKVEHSATGEFILRRHIREHRRGEDTDDRPGY